MKRFLGKPPRPGSPPGARSVHSEPDSLADLPMFSDLPATNDPALNLNPSITASESVAESSQAPGKSVFSSRYSASTQQSSFAKCPKKHAAYGQPLQILEADERGDGGDATSAASIAARLHALHRDVAYASGQYSSSALNLSSAVVAIIGCLQEFVQFMQHPAPALRFAFHAYNNADVRRVLRVYLHFYDNLLRDDAYVRLRLLLCKTFNDFAASLSSSRSGARPHLAKPQNFAVGANDGMPLHNQAAICRIVQKLASTNRALREQNGSFIAPIARGIGKDMNVLCLYFGYPQITEQHSQIPANIHELYDDVHVIVAQNRIEPAAARGETASGADALPKDAEPQIDPVVHFKLPFRNPDSSKPPMSLSLSTESSTRASGTLGGFVYPIIDTQKQPELTSYAASKFAITCGHVCLENDKGSDYPYVASPSAVLISLYKKALKNEYDKLDPESGLDSRIAYRSILAQIDRMFPLVKAKIHDPKTGSERTELRNLPRHRLGQIIWGERTLVQAKKSSTGAPIRDKRLSDLAIIKVNKLMQCDQNYLGDDVAFNEYDPSLMFDNLYVRRIIDVQRHAKELEWASVHEVDSVLSTSSRNADGSFNNSHGLPVFKYGSTTKFTRGHLNGVKLVYWMDGAIHSSEFVVNSAENTTAFAAGGDSGAWILAKLEDVRGCSEKGLGVVGMLHSYDGEYRQFGLFTPMNEILDRLQDVTNIAWGVVGVPRKGEAQDSEHSEADSGHSEADSDLASDSDYESGVEDHAYPPDID